MVNPKKKGGIVKVIARVRKISVEQYEFQGKIFNSFLSARREMAEFARPLRLNRRESLNRRSSLRFNLAQSASGPQA